MTILEKIAAETPPEDSLFWSWQFELARRIAQVLEESGMNQREFGEAANLTEAQVSALLHSASNPTLSILARIAARVPAELLNWVNTDAVPKAATVYQLSGEQILKDSTDYDSPHSESMIYAEVH